MQKDGEVRRVSSASLGGPGLADSVRCSQAAAEALGEAAGPGFRLSSLSVDLAGHALGEGDIEIATTVDKRTRAIVFASVEARAADVLVFSAQGLFAPAGGRS